MEYQFEIVGWDNQEVTRQLHRAVFGPSMKLVSIAFVVCGLAMMLLGWHNRDLARMVSACVYFLGPALMGQVPKWIADRAYKERLKYYDGETPEVTAHFGENLLLEDKDSSRTILYDKITKVYYMPDALVIQVGMQFAVAVPYQSFTKGSLPELKQFLREKCPNAKISE